MRNVQVAGNILGDVGVIGTSPTAPGPIAYIENVIVTGTIGTPADPVTIRAQRINGLTASAIYGDVGRDGTSDPVAENPRAFEIKTTSGPLAGGTIRLFDATYVDSSGTPLGDGRVLDIAGDLESQVRFDENATFMQGTIAREVFIGGSAKPNSRITTFDLVADARAALPMADPDTPTGKITIGNDVETGAVIRVRDDMIGSASITIADELAGTLLIEKIADIPGDPTQTPTLTVGGDLAGTLSVLDHYDGALTIGGAVQPGSALVFGGTYSGTLDIAGAVNEEVDFDGGLTGTTTITGPLTHQVFINLSNHAANVWTGPTSVNGVTLTNLPHYPQLPADIGGGAIGLGPFATHLEASDPPSGTTLISSTMCMTSNKPGPCEVTLEFYGPVTGPGGTANLGAAFTVECRTLGTSNPWTDVSGAFYAEFDAVGDGRAVRIIPDPANTGAAFMNGTEFRVTPKGTVTCVGVGGSQAVDPARQYTFGVDFVSGDCLIADVTTTGTTNGIPDGAVDLSDFSFYLSLWSATDPAADITATGTCDTHAGGDGTVDLSDFSCFLSNWSGTCS